MGRRDERDGGGPAAADNASSGERGSNTLLYFPEKKQTWSSAVALFQLTSPILVGGLLMVVLPEWALPGMVVAGLGFWLWRRRSAKRPQMRLEVVDDQLKVFDRAGRIVFSPSLEELDDVMLDTRTIERVQENMSSGMPDTRFIDATVMPPQDECKIELVTYDDTLVLTEHYTSSIDATHWYVVIRRFLQDNGWTPLLERDEE